MENNALVVQDEKQIESFNLEAWRQQGAEIVARGRAADRQHKENRRIRDNSLWELGDWIISGEKHLSAAYDEAAKITGLARGRLYTIVSVVRAFPTSRRREDLDFSHYYEVMTLAWDEKLQDRLLEQGSKEQLSIREMKTRVAYERKWASKEHVLKQIGSSIAEEKERKKEQPKKIVVWMNPKSADAIRLIARAHKKQPGEVLNEWAHAHYIANREAINDKVKELDAKMKAERKQKNAGEPKRVNVSKLFKSKKSVDS